MIESFFVNPWMLAGLSAAALPFVIDWLFRRRRQTIALPTLRYLLKQKEQAKIKRQDRILLILRTVACALVALALTRPIIRSAAAAGAGKRQVIIVLDATASMNQQFGVSTAFGLAKKRAAEILRALPEGTGSTVALLTHEMRVIAEDNAELQALAAQVESLRPSEGAGHMSAALIWAKDLASKSDAASKDVYIFSDFQKYTWMRGTDETKRCAEAMRALTASCATFLVDVGGKQDFNYMVTLLAPRDPVLSTSMPVTFDATVELRGTPPADTKPSLTLMLEGPLDGGGSGKPEKKGICSLNGAGTAAFDLRFPAPGEYLVSVEIEGDAYRIDNRRSFLCRVPENSKVLVLDESLEKEEADRASFFLERAIAPPVRPGFEPVSRFSVKLQHPARAAFENFAEFASIVIIPTSTLSEALASKLQQYVMDGGDVCFFAGPSINVYEYNKFLFKDGKGLLPCAWEPPVTKEESEQYDLAFSGTKHPVVQTMAMNFQSTPIKVRGFMPLKSGGNPAGVEELAQVTDSAHGKSLPAIVERRFGRGRVIQFIINAEPSWSNLPASTEFVVLMQELLRHQIGQPDAASNLEVGQSFESVVKLSAQQLLLKGPDGLRARVTPRKAEDEDAWRMRFDETSRAGLYEIDTLPEAMPRRRFVVSMRNEEGDLERVDGEALAQALASREFHWQRPDVPIVETIAQRHSATELALFILAVLGAVLAAESFLAAKFGRRRSAMPEQKASMEGGRA